MLMNVYHDTVTVLHGEDKMVNKSRQGVSPHEIDSLVRKKKFNVMITQIT